MVNKPSESLKYVYLSFDDMASYESSEISNAFLGIINGNVTSL